MVVFVQKLLYSGKSSFIRGKAVVFGQSGSFRVKVVRNSFPFSIPTELYERLTRCVVKDYYYLLIVDVAR